MLKNSAMKGRTATASPPARPFQCQWHEGCPKSFNRKSDLQRHYRIHTNERPYACDYKPCEKTFIQRSALTVHRRTHTGDKPHKCPYLGCGKCFSDSSSLARHRRIHTNDKPYICKNPHCRKAFCRKTTMTKHFRKEHPTESLDQEEDAEFTDGDFSDDEPGLEHDVDSLSSTEYPFDHCVKSERSSNAAASNYNTNLWPLPAQTAQRPTSNAVKMERSLSGASQRSVPEPNLPQGGYIPRSNTLPNSIPRSHSTDMSVWDRPLDSPTSISTTGDYTLQSMPTSAAPFQHNLPIRRPSLQPVNDLIHDDPTTYVQSQPRPTHAPQTHFPPNYRGEMPQTPANGRQEAPFTQSMEDDGIPFEAYTVPANNIYNLPTNQSVGMLADYMDPWKDPSKIDNPWAQMPDQAPTQWPQ